MTDMSRADMTALLRTLKVGDTTPAFGEVDRKLLPIVKARRTTMANITADSRVGPRDRLSQKILGEVNARRAREGNAIEQAARYLRGRGYQVYDRGVVHGYPHKGYQVGRVVLPDAAAMMAHATRLGWKWEG